MTDDLQRTNEELEVEEDPVVSFKEFLEDCPPGSFRKVSDCLKYVGYNRNWKVQQPELELHCDAETCNGKRFFTCQSAPDTTDSNEWMFFEYHCKNCINSTKAYAILTIVEEGKVSVYKMGEFPEFGPPIPSRVMTMVGPDRDLFLKGRRAENQGLGIGAFSYYRRVVENQKNRLIDQIIKVAKTLKTSAEDIKRFEEAKKENQFKKAVEDLKDLIPQVLLINGHNPLTLLHSALSKGLHDASDEDCLEYATSIRIILTELAESIGVALKDQVEIQAALSKLLKAD